MKIKCIAVDDEPLALDIMTDYIQKIPFLNLLSTFDNAIDCLDYVKYNKVDLLLLDIQMDNLTGIQLVNIIEPKPYIIFTTAYDRFALLGYDLDVSDYLLKPISFERFIKAVNKVHDKIHHSAISENSLQDGYFFVKTEFRYQKVNYNDILYIEGMGDYLRIITKNEKIMSLQNLKSMSDSLPEDQFLRVHKSFIVSLNKIDYVEKNFVKVCEKLIPVSESYKKKLLLLLENHSLMF